MATGNDFEELERNSNKPKIVLTAATLTWGSKYISSKEKAMSIRRSPKETLEDVIGLAEEGLGIKNTSIADQGEDPVGLAATSVIKLCLQYGLNLNDVNNMLLGTESPEGISESDVPAVANAVRKMAKVLLKNGIDVGTLKDDKMIAPLHVQGACVSEVLGTNLLANSGISIGKTIVLAADNAKYGYGSGPDLTGGCAATAILFEDSRSAGERGLKIYPNVATASTDKQDFIKKIMPVLNEEKGIAYVNRYAIVEGTYSEYLYFFKTYEALRAMFAGKEEELFDYRKFIDTYMIDAHTPYKKIGKKALSQLIRHFARHDQALAAELNSQLNGATEPLMHGFTSLKREMEFMLKVEGTFIALSNLQEMRERVTGYGDVNGILRINRVLESNVAFFGRAIVEELEEVKQEMRLDQSTIELLGKAQARIKGVVQRQGKFDELMDAMCVAAPKELGKKEKIEFDEKMGKEYVINYIRHFQALDNAYSRRIRDTALFKEGEEKLYLDSFTWLASESGNPYTASLDMGLQSGIAKDVPRNKKVLRLGFGSNTGASVAVAEFGSDCDYLFKRVKEGVDFEIGRREPIGKIDLLKLRNNSSIAVEGPNKPMIQRHGGFVEINECKLLEMAQKIGVDLKRVGVQQDRKQTVAAK
ncbi:MAG: hypothetical protein KGH61_05025 [Candidatus Micrarchaeota archaeon]|nr:hypothetical protein [Candidatus Micrarchaeota archaeon]MDE1848278.1 hypothetical protein [Candidatus Micrarchaeota archaeon]MDE1864585.1 hypothetical protein [Candidatus Micrarchaeota archaeon]